MVLTARREDRLEALAKKIEAAGGRALAVAGDVPNEKAGEAGQPTARAGQAYLIVGATGAGSLPEAAVGLLRSEAPAAGMHWAAR